MEAYSRQITSLATDKRHKWVQSFLENLKFNSPYISSDWKLYENPNIPRLKFRLYRTTRILEVESTTRPCYLGKFEKLLIKTLTEKLGININNWFKFPQQNEYSTPHSLIEPMPEYESSFSTFPPKKIPPMPEYE